MSKRRTRWSPGSARRGFTLIELMVVITIVGVLAALGIYGVRKYMLAARSSEAGEMINAIRSAQESYRSDAMTYLDVSGAHAVTDMSTFYPTTKPGNFKTAWGDVSTEIGKRWKALNVHTDGGGVYYAYACSAGEPTDKLDGPDVDNIWQTVTTKQISPWPPTGFLGQWYVVKVVGDLDNTGAGTRRQLWVAPNFSDQVFFNSDSD